MRDLREAIKEGPRAAFVSATHLPGRHPGPIAGLLGGLVCVVLFLGLADTRHDVGSVNKRITKVESPCLKYGAKSDQCKEAFEQAVLTITHAQACAILRKAGLEVVSCAGARLEQERGRRKDREANQGPHHGSAGEGVVDSNGHAPSSQPGPGRPGPQGGKPDSGAIHPLSPPGAAPAAQPVSASPPSQSPPVSGNANQPDLPEQAKGPVEKTTDPVVKAVDETITGTTGKADCLLDKNCKP
jgi:hypothetical protein